MQRSIRFIMLWTVLLAVPVIAAAAPPAFGESNGADQAAGVARISVPFLIVGLAIQLGFRKLVVLYQRRHGPWRAEQVAPVNGQQPACTSPMMNPARGPQ